MPLLTKTPLLTMRKTGLLILLLTFCTVAMAQEQDSTHWTHEGTWGINFANVGLENWAGGGVSSISIGTIFHAAAKRETDKSIWNNKLDFAYGILRQGDSDNPFKKTDDALILLTQYNRKVSEKWSWGVTAILRTQVTEGYNYMDDPNNPGEETKELISDFMAPGYLSLNLGMEYKIGDVFTVSFAPAAGKFTFVMDDELSAMGAFGVDPGKNSRAEFGSNMLASLNLKIMENMTFKSNLNFFTAYESFGNVDTNWETLLVMKINKWFNATFGTQLIYDDDVKIEMEDGALERAIQFKHVLNIGANFTLFK